MTITASIVDRLSALGLGTISSDLFEQFMPEEAGGIVVVMPLTGVEVDHEVPQARVATVQVIVRDKTRSAADLALEVFEKLGAKEIRVNRHWLRYLRPVHEPVPFQRSPGGRYEYLINFEVSYIDEISPI